jgi:hypothetical protein
VLRCLALSAGEDATEAAAVGVWNGSTNLQPSNLREPEGKRGEESESEI